MRRQLVEGGLVAVRDAVARLGVLGRVAQNGGTIVLSYTWAAAT
jgi:hypothetical protein